MRADMSLINKVIVSSEVSTEFIKLVGCINMLYFTALPVLGGQVAIDRSDEAPVLIYVPLATQLDPYVQETL
jgi:hypothetical protein